MGHYIPNPRDLAFNLFDVLRLDRVLDAGAYGDLDSATVRRMLDEVARLAKGPIADSFTASDRAPGEFLPTEHAVSVPEPLKATIKAVRDAQWWRLGIDPELGGVPAPTAVTWALQEMITAANPSAVLFTFGPPIFNLLYKIGDDRQKRWAKAGFERGWTATMAMTEPDAGSDVGAVRTRAVAQPDGTWHIEGIKRFISVGDVGDLAENILHMVIARPVGAAPGTKGLSLFVVPKYLLKADTTELGTRNGAFVTGVDQTMGLRGSPTCEVTFGGTPLPAVGYLVGDLRDGIAQMFSMLEFSRMNVGVKATGTLSSGYLNALAYARSRVQGIDLASMADSGASPVAIVRHPDVRRSLLMQKAYAEGLRALYLYAAAHRYDCSAELVRGVPAELARRVNDLLLPVVKAVSGGRAYEMLTESLQTLGGSGYLKDHPIEQYIRDTKADSVYEGTTAILALEFFFRKIVRDGAVAFDHLLSRIEEFTQLNDDFEVERRWLRVGAADLRSMLNTLLEYLTAAADNPTAVYKIGLVSVRFLHAFGDLVIAWRLLVNAEIARSAMALGPPSADTAFHRGKVSSASFFASTVLPRLGADRLVIENIDTTVMELDDDAL
ncbi:acyl-CoA dehydrogenase [Mycolicibacterium elephantis]